MGLFSKFLSENKEAQNALNKLRNFADQALKNAADQQNNAPQPQQQGYNQPVYNQQPQQTWAPAEPAPSGWSWGETMPDEENQFSFNGRYNQYFETVFREAFPEYGLNVEQPRGRDCTIFTFTQGGRVALIVEVMSQSSSAQALRRNCRANGTPYLRFYHNHEGWWNTRSYVVTRVRNALAG